MLNNLALNFRLFSFPIRIEIGFLLIAGFIAASGGLAFQAWPEIILWVFVSIMVHEFGHALVGKAFGRSSSIRLHMFGGYTEWLGNPGELSNFRNILITAAGPFFGTLFGTIFFLVYEFTGMVPHVVLQPEQAMTYILFINWGWSVLNLIPLFPLDGGQILYYSLRYIKGIDAMKVAAWVGIVLGVGLGGLCLWAEEWWGLFMIGMLTYQNFQRIGQKQDEKLEPEVEHIQSLLKSGQMEAALREIEVFLDKAKSRPYKNWAEQWGARIYLSQDDLTGLEAFVNKYPSVKKSFPPAEYELIKKYEGEEKANEFALQTFPFSPSEELAVPFFLTLIRRKDFGRVIREYKNLRDQTFKGRLGGGLALQLFHAEAYKEAVEVGKFAFGVRKEADIAYNVACSLAKLGRKDDGLTWLGKAVESGFRDADKLWSDPDLAGLRGSAGFDAILKKIG